MFTGIEGANAYDVLNPDGQVIAHAAESTGGMHSVLLGSGRLESIALRNAAGEQVLSLKERWGFPFSTHHITNPAGEPLFRPGGDSGLVTDETAQKAAQKAATTVPDGEWLHIPGAGHNVFEDNPADAISAI